MLGLLLLLLLQEDRISDRLDLLGDDSAEVRDGATAELIGLGEAARVALGQRLLSTADAEVQTRIQAILRRLDLVKRRKEFDGGKLVDDLGVRLSIVQDPDGRKLALTIEISNLGTVDRTIVEPKRWNLTMPDGHHHSSGSEGEIRVRQLSGERASGGYGSYACGGRPRHLPMVLRAGETRRFTSTIDITELRAGAHQVEVALEAGIHGTSAELVSNSRPFTVER